MTFNITRSETLGLSHEQTRALIGQRVAARSEEMGRVLVGHVLPLASLSAQQLLTRASARTPLNTHARLYPHAPVWF